MSTATRRAIHSFEDFCAIIADGQKADLIQEVIYVASPDNTDANDLFMWFGGLMYDFAQLRDLGKVYGSRVAFRLDHINGPEPDIAFVRQKRLNRVRRRYVMGEPDLAVEIVSPESIERDYQKKRAQYQEAGVQEYWIVDEPEKRLRLRCLGRDGKYREARSRKGALHSKVLPGFWIRPEWLWQNPLPVKARILQQILSGGD
jgi:Uma2 family endonuclease